MDGKGLRSTVTGKCEWLGVNDYDPDSNLHEYVVARTVSVMAHETQCFYDTITTKGTNKPRRFGKQKEQYKHVSKDKNKEAVEVTNLKGGEVHKPPFWNETENQTTIYQLSIQAT